ncbi:MAG: hypothetical protein NTV29_00315 [Planctomycetota bacterium]|nr:hypothetical protein [Planctomycetota bacterium]
MKVLDTVEVNVAVSYMTGAKENWARTAKLVVLGSVAVPDFQQAFVNQLLECDFSSFTRHNLAPLDLL